MLDPIAFAMHNYNTMGDRIGMQDEVAESRLRNRIAVSDKAMASAFTRELIAFVIGRKTTVYDRAVVKSVLQKTEQDGYRMRDILSEIVGAHFRE
jgi:hypothetical protein